MARGTIVTRITDDGSKRYHTVIRVNGKQQWRTFRKKKQAEDYLDELSPDIRDGSYRELKKATFGQYIEQWKATYLIPGVIDENNNLTKKRLTPPTIRGYRTIIDTLLIPEWEHKQMQAIGPDRIEDLNSKLLQRFSNKSAFNALQLAKRIFRNAVKDGYLKVSPMDGFEMPKYSCKKGRALKPEEAQKLLAKMEGDRRLMVMLCLLAGLRRGEMLGLRWTDIDFDHDVLHVRRSLVRLSRKHNQIADGQPAYVFQPPKYNSFRAVDLSPLLKAELRKSRMKAKDKEGLLFVTTEGTPENPSNVYNRLFQPAVKAAEIGKLDLHDLRHTFGSWKVEQGENVVYVSKQMGHKDPSVTLKIYAHLIKESRPEAAAKTDAMLVPQAPASQTVQAATQHVN
jgi:integrase